MKILSLFLTLFFLLSCTEKNTEDKNKKQPPVKTAQKHKRQFVKAAHYFADAWPKTFWQEFEKGKVEADFEQIKADGFNTLIFVLPWKGFETDFQKKQTTSVKKMYQRLDFLVQQTKKHGLDYMLRLGFPHDYTDNTGSDETANICQKMYQQPEQQLKWLDYLKKVKKVTDKSSDNLVGILVSWEDFWCPHFIFPHLSATKRQKLAEEIGYSQWLWQKDKTLLKMILGSNDIKKEQIKIPQKQEMSYFYYLEFIDEKFDQLVLQSTKSIFPQTAMEIRVDKDPAKSSSGENIWVSHNLYLDEENHRGTYWAPFWGAANNGEELTAAKAIKTFTYFLKYISNNGKAKNHIIEQFNFVDNTPYFPNNAKIKETQVEEFLQKAAPLLKKYSAGYGLWSYRDYADNVLYNASFEWGLSGWEQQKATIKGNENDQQIEIKAGGFISQSFHASARMLLARNYDLINLCLNAQKTGKISVNINDKLETQLDLKKGNSCYVISAEGFKQIDTRLTIKAETDVIIDELKLYGFVQKLDVYDEFNRPSKYRNAIRKLNNALK